MKDKFNINQIPNLKDAIIDLPDKEKNQLLIRLINKDQILIEHLHFKLLENEYDLINRFEKLNQEILSELKTNFSMIINSKENLNANLLLRLVRNLSGSINHFVKVTKDSNYELELRTILWIESNIKYKSILVQDSVFAYKLRNYQITRIKAIIKLFIKLHEDLQFDFLEKYKEDLELIFDNELKFELKSANISMNDFEID